MAEAPEVGKYRRPDLIRPESARRRCGFLLVHFHGSARSAVNALAERVQLPLPVAMHSGCFRSS